MRWIAGILFLTSLNAWADSYAAYPFGDFHWKSPVASTGVLPTTGNGVGDARIETTTFTANVWNGSAWVALGGGSGTVTNVTASSPLASSGGATPNISLTGLVPTAKGGTNHGNFSPNVIPFADGAGTTLTEDGSNLSWDPVNSALLIGTSTPIVNSSVTVVKNDENSYGFGLVITQTPTVTVDDSDANNFNIALEGSIGPIIKGHHTENADMDGVLGAAYRNDLSDNGSLSGIVAIEAGYGHTGIDASAVTTTAAGLRITGSVDSGTITNMYDLYVLPGELGGGTVTHRYGIYVSPDDSGTKINYLGGTTILGGAYQVPGSNDVLSLKDGHFASVQTTAPVATVDAHAGTGATCSVSSATDTKMHIALTTTATSPSSGAQCSIAFNKSYGSAPVVAGFVPTNSNAATLSVSSGVYVTTDTGHVVINFAVTDAIGHTYTWDASLME